MNASKQSDYLLDDISTTILVKSEPTIQIVPDELNHFPPQDLANVHDNSFTTYFSDPDAFNLNLCNEEVVYTEGAAEEYVLCVDDVENVHNIDEDRVRTEFVKYSSGPGSFFDQSLASCYACALCSMSFMSPSDLSSHLRTHSESVTNYIVQKSDSSESNLCNHCNVKFDSNKELRKHIANGNVCNANSSGPAEGNQSASKPYTCQYCHLNFNRAKALVSHSRKHEANTSEIPIKRPLSKLKCRNCGRKLSSQRRLVAHFVKCMKMPQTMKRSHSGCDKLKPTSISTATTPTKVKPHKHQCDHCPKTFGTKQKMHRHMWIHRKKAFSCEVCATSFGMQSELDEHRLSKHSEASPYVCSECGKNFTSRQGLWEHNRSHSQANILFNCDQCTKTFASRQGLVIHTRTHTGERPCYCSYCDKSFRDAGTLRKHQRIHTGERPHKCPLCEKNFNQKIVLREHVRWVHASNKNEYPEPPPFVCALCTLAMSDREELCSHIVKHSDQIAAFNKENANFVELFPSAADTNDLFSNKPIGAKYDPVVVQRNRVILTRLAQPIISFADIIDTTGTTTHDCQICAERFEHKQLLINHSSVHDVIETT